MANQNQTTCKVLGCERPVRFEGKDDLCIVHVVNAPPRPTKETREAARVDS